MFSLGIFNTITVEPGKNHTGRKRPTVAIRLGFRKIVVSGRSSGFPYKSFYFCWLYFTLSFGAHVVTQFSGNDGLILFSLVQ